MSLLPEWGKKKVELIGKCYVDKENSICLFVKDCNEVTYFSMLTFLFLINLTLVKFFVRDATECHHFY